MTLFPNPFPKGQHGLIYADPAWAYEMYSEKGEAKSPYAHYDCMTMPELKALRDDILFANLPDSVLVMWAVFPMLPQALELMAHYGFTFCTGGPWVKLTSTGKRAFGTGYVLRGAAECFLIGTRGSPRIKNRATRNLLYSGDIPADLRDIGVTVNTQRREHSQKPDEMYTLLENLFDGPYLELFANETRAGWSSWGKPHRATPAKSSSRA